MTDTSPAPIRESIHWTQSGESIRWTQSAEERAAAARRDRIAVVAYHLSEARGFAPGHDAEDWALAEAQVDAAALESQCRALMAAEPAAGSVHRVSTSAEAVRGAGDVCNLQRFTHVAEATARLAVHNALGGRIGRQSHLTIPSCTYCDPEIAHIGMHMRDARRQSIPIKSFTIMMQDVDRAITDGPDHGFVKIYVREGTDRILGASIVAGRATEMINEMSVIMSAGIGMRQLATILHTYPAQSDAIRLAAMTYVDSHPLPIG